MARSNDTTSSLAGASTGPRQILSRSLAHPDSGYATGANTSFASPVKSIKDRHAGQAHISGGDSDNDASLVQIRSVPVPGREDLQAFRMNMDEAFTARFREIVPEVQRLLKKCSTQRGSLVGRGFLPSKRLPQDRVMPVSCRLMTVGKTLDSAKPSVVVFVHGEQTGRIENILKQPLVLRLCQPDDGITPYFEILVVGEAPRKRFLAETDVCAVWDGPRERDMATYCGTRIRLGRAGGRLEAAATVGGLLKLGSTADFRLVAMTAGHVLEDLDLEDLTPHEDRGEQRSSEGGWENDGATETEAAKHAEYPSPLHPRFVGMFFETRDGSVPPHDWALFEVTSQKIKPNLLRRHGQGFNMARDRADARQPLEMKAAPPESFPVVEPIEVVLLSGSQGALFGKLSHLPGGIMLGGGAADCDFQEAYLLTLDEGEEGEPRRCYEDVERLC